MTPRVVALCVFRDRDRILAFEARDDVAGETFFRPLGGGVEFREYAAEAVVREIREELGAEITGVALLGVLENLFHYEGRPHHEVLFVFDARLADAALYERRELTAQEADGTVLRARWKTPDDFATPGHPPLYPQGLTELLGWGHPTRQAQETVQASYDAVAERYAEQFLDELRHKPLDRALLDAFAEQVPPGRVVDVGCGPGQVARYLHDRGRDVLGVDLSPAMIAQARHHHPQLAFEVGSLLALAVGDGVWSGVTAFYAIVHLTTDELGEAVRELHRVLCPGGLLLLAFHVGGEVRHFDEWWGRPVSLDFHLFPTEVVVAALEDAGFTVEGRLERLPYPHEVDTRRAYLLARKASPG